MQTFTASQIVDDKAVEPSDLVTPLPRRSTSELDAKRSRRAPRTSRENSKRSPKNVLVVSPR